MRAGLLALLLATGCDPSPARHAAASSTLVLAPDGTVQLSPELVDYKLFRLEDVRCWPAGTGYALAQWLRSRGHEPQFVEWGRR